MEVDTDYDNPDDSDEPPINASDINYNGTNNDQNDLIYHEIWDNTERAEIDEDFVQNNETPPTVNVEARPLLGHRLRNYIDMKLDILRL